jgi:phosphate transport system substrate-binding protein
MNYHQYLLSILICVCCIASCDDNNGKVLDNQTSGSIAISIDETYKPVMEEQIKVFEGRNLRAKINASYKPEADCIKDFIEDTTRLIFITRPLTEDEKQLCLQKKFTVTRELPLVRDAVAFIVNKNSPSEFTQAAFLDILKGKTNHQIVFDNQNSSTYRYVQDSILKGAEMTKNKSAAKGCEDLIAYVQSNPNAIGAIGVSWIADNVSDKADAFLDKINVVGILPYNDSITRYRKPLHAYIARQEYPYCRELYFISKEAYIGLGTGFANYLGREGQLVFDKNRLFPLQFDVRIKQIRVK